MVCPKTRLDKIFPDGLPVNAFIDKGRCAIGATYGEIAKKDRCTIIVVPSLSIIDSKFFSHPELDIVCGKKSYDDVEEMLRVPKPGQKFMTTPEGIKKIMVAAEKLGRLEEFKREWFLLLDEAHTFITEHFREDILLPFEYFWWFDNRSIISATPYFFSDPRFKMMDFHQIKFTSKLGLVRLINSKSVAGTLNYILKHADEFPGNLHIFYNSVTEIVNAIRRSGITDFTICCAVDQKGKNMMKIELYLDHFVAEPNKNTYRKINFYTSKYFEGWDLFDKDATAILVTDVHKQHTKVGVATKGKQAVGRIREDKDEDSNLFQILHVTNHSNNRAMKALESFRSDYLVQANLLIQQNEIWVNLYNQQGQTIIQDERLPKFADIDKVTKLAILNTYKLDQQINEAAKHEIYNHIDYIQKDWEDAYFEVVREDVDFKVETGTNFKRKSAATQLKEDYETLKAYKAPLLGSIVVSLRQSIEQSIKNSNPLAYQAYKLLDDAEMQKCKFNIKKVQAAVIVKENNSVRLKLSKLLHLTFRVNNFYSNDQIKNKLQQIYKELNIRDSKGNVKVAIANQIAANGCFEVKVTKKKNAKGIEEHGMVILRPQFALRMAA